MAENEEKVVSSDGVATRKMVTRLLIVAVLIMIATPVITVLAFRAMSQEVIKPREKDPRLTEIALPTIQVNVAGSNATRYVQVDTVVRISDPSMAELFEEQSAQQPNGHLREIQAATIRVIGDKPLNALLPTEGKRELASEIKATLNDLLAEYTTGMVTDVYFCGFLIQ